MLPNSAPIEPTVRNIVMKLPPFKPSAASGLPTRRCSACGSRFESPSITEMAVALGMDWVVIDAEHGHLDWKEIVRALRATARSETVALVRIAELNGGLIKRALDIGADGIVVPWVETGRTLSKR